MVLISVRAVNIVAIRLREAMDLRDVDQTALAASVGITQGAISQILNGKTRKSKHLPDIARVLNVSLTWLMGRDGEMLRRPASEPNVTAEELNLLMSYRALPTAMRASVDNMIESLAIVALIDSGMIQVGAEGLDEADNIASQLLQSRLRAAPSASR